MKMEMKLLTSSCWKEYELLDSGNFEKLERFGKFVLIRPEPQALWDKTFSPAEWDSMADAVFSKDKGSDEKGRWIVKNERMPQQWTVGYAYKQMNLRMRLGLTSFKHVGLFPEQAENWNYIYDAVSRKKQTGTEPNVLNLFAYTGGATLAAAAAGAQVTHVDSVKQVVAWAKENAQHSSLENVRWIVDDARKFVKRQARKENKYDGIILDPPAYGRGPEGEKWVVEDDIYPFLLDCRTLIKPDGFVVLNLYSMGFSALLAKGLLQQVFKPGKEIEYGELYFKDNGDKSLPLGIFARYDAF